MADRSCSCTKGLVTLPSYESACWKGWNASTTGLGGHLRMQSYGTVSWPPNNTVYLMSQARYQVQVRICPSHGTHLLSANSTHVSSTLSAPRLCCAIGWRALHIIRLSSHWNSCLRDCYGLAASYGGRSSSRPEGTPTGFSIPNGAVSLAGGRGFTYTSFTWDTITEIPILSICFINIYWLHQQLLAPTQCTVCALAS